MQNIEVTLEIDQAMLKKLAQGRTVIAEFEKTLVMTGIPLENVAGYGDGVILLKNKKEGFKFIITLERSKSRGKRTERKR